MQEKSSSFPLSKLAAVSPIDGRYREKTESLAPYFSEHGLIKHRLEVECKWIAALSEGKIIRPLSPKEKRSIETVSKNFSLQDAEEVKRYEKKTEHDVKALEMFLRERLSGDVKDDLLEYIHFGLTSEDVNNLSYRLIIQRSTKEVMLPSIEGIVDDVLENAQGYKNLPMLARTHGQPAVPTTLGKELAVFAVRINKEAGKLREFQLTGKITGAVGSYNALSASYPETDWIRFTDKFIKSLELTPNTFTTQINPYEDIIELLQIYQRVNGVMLDFDQDMWRYISDNWLVQSVKKDEVGSSTMPQKVNPIHFENSEGNIGIANSLIEHMTRKLPVSRLQRDLSDSTVIRNFGSILGYSLISYASSRKGLSRVSPNQEEINSALQRDWSILGEGVQTILRRSGVNDPYSLIKSMTRGEHISRNDWERWVDSLPIGKDEKSEILKLTPSSYIGLAPDLVDHAALEISRSRKHR